MSTDVDRYAVKALNSQNILPVFTSNYQYLPVFTSIYQYLPVSTSIY